MQVHNNILALSYIILAFMYDRYKGIPVTIKVIQRGKGPYVTPWRIDTFQEEVSVHSKVQHENIVKVGRYIYYELKLSYYYMFVFNLHVEYNDQTLEAKIFDR